MLATGYLLFSLFVSADCNYESFVKLESNGVTKMQSKKSGNYNIQTLMTLTDGNNCNKVTVVGLFRVYGVKFAIERINAESSILPNISIGYEINDACRSVPITMARGIDILRTYRNSVCHTKRNYCFSEQINIGQNVAVIGAYYSYVTLPLASLLNLHNIPQISYGSSSPLLSKTTLYPSFFRTIPSDKNQITVFIEILRHMNWTYNFIIGSDDEYGKLAVSELKKEAEKFNICFTGDMLIPRDVPETEDIAKEIVKKLQDEDKATVVVMFGYAKGMAYHILIEAEKIGLKRFWLTSEGWNPHILKVNAPINQLSSVLTVSLVKGKLPEFISYLRDIVTRDFYSDVWLHTYIYQQYCCDVTSVENGYLTGVNCSDRNKKCSLSISSVTENILQQDPNQVNNLVDAVYAVVYGIQAVLRKLCENQNENKTCLPSIAVDELAEVMKNVSFTNLQNKSVSFDENGDLKDVSYSIENIHLENGVPQYHSVGNWLEKRDEKLNLDMSKVKWPTWFKEVSLKSECSPPCQPGEYIVGKRGCCWECRSCEMNSASNTVNAKKCVECPNNYYTKDYINCHKTEIIFLRFKSTVGVIISSISMVGFILTLVLCVGYCQIRRTTGIKMAGSLLPTLAFFTLFAIFLFVPLVVTQPNKTICTTRDIYFHMVGILYASMLYVQNNSVLHFLLKLTNDKKQNKMLGQVLIYSLLILIQIIFISVWKSTSETQVDIYKTSIDELFEQCDTSYPIMKVLVIVYPILVLAMATITAFIDRHHEHKFNEPKYLNYTCIASCIVTVAHVVSIKQAKGKFHAMASSLTFNAYGFVYLLCMMLPRLYLSYMHREQGTHEGVVNEAYVKYEQEEEEIQKENADVEDECKMTRL